VSRRFQVADGLAILLLTVVSVLVLMPFVFMLSTSLRLPRESFTLPPKWLPTDLRVQNYADVFALVPMGTYMLNSVKVTASIVVGQVATASLAAYAFARLRFPGKGPLFFLLMSAMMVPLLVTIIPIFVLVRTLGLVDSHASLILPALTTPFGVFLLRQFFLTIPRELEDAARLDGAGEWTIFWRVALPLSKPALATLAVFAFADQWKNFLWPLIVTRSTPMQVVEVGVASFHGLYYTNWPYQMAAALAVALPLIVLFFFAQRYFIQGIQLTGMK
jgi:multiple sugar transport system permease protein